MNIHIFLFQLHFEGNVFYSYGVNTNDFVFLIYVVANDRL